MTQTNIKNINKYCVNSLSETQNIATQFAKQIKTGTIIVLSGDLGVGKTEFVKTICTELGVNDVITSPSFTLINQYESDFANIFHIDLYRIVRQDELFDMGFYELFDTSNSIFFIE